MRGGERARRSTLERMIGEAEEYLSVMFIARALLAVRSVGRIAIPGSFGTGFLVAPGVLMTNNHVLADPGTAAEGLVQFRYEVDLANTEIAPSEFRLEPERLFVTDRDLDFSLVAVARRRAMARRSTTSATCPLSRPKARSGSAGRSTSSSTRLASASKWSSARAC